MRPLEPAASTTGRQAALIVFFASRSTNQCILMQFSRSSKSPDKRWYLGVICAKCRTPILFGLDRTEGKGPFEPPAMLFLTCSETECGHRADYSGAKVSAHQKNP